MNKEKSKDIAEVKSRKTLNAKAPKSKIHIPKFMEIIKVMILVFITTALSSVIFFQVSKGSAYIIQKIIEFIIK